jgi:hypothetical protein
MTLNEQHPRFDITMEFLLFLRPSWVRLARIEMDLGILPHETRLILRRLRREHNVRVLRHSSSACIQWDSWVRAQALAETYFQTVCGSAARRFL